MAQDNYILQPAVRYEMIAASTRKRSGSMLLISKVELPEGADAAAFGEFVRDTYIPAVHKGPTRVGQVAGLELVEGGTDKHRTFLWLVRWSGISGGAGVHVDDEAVRQRFEEFGATIKKPVVWQEVGRWPAAD
jgi:hypothetical protein